MMLRNKFFYQIYTIMLISIFPIVAGAVNFTQTVTLEKDGSGIIKLIYSEKESLVKENKFVVGNLPFSKDKSEEFFNSNNTSIRLFEVSNDPKDNTIIQVIVSMNFKDINKISEMKALSNAIVGLYNTDSGNVFKYVITPTFTKANSLDNVYTILIYNGKLKSSNGDSGKESISWFRAKEYLNKKDIFLYAVLESEVKTVSKDNENKEKSCGLFGLELPIIISLGFVFSKFAKRRKE